MIFGYYKIGLFDREPFEWIPFNTIRTKIYNRSIRKQVVFDKSSYKYFSDPLLQNNFLTKLHNETVDHGKKVLDDLHEIIKTIARPEKSFLHVAGNAHNMIKKFGSDLTIFNSILNESSAPATYNKNKRFQLKQGHEYRQKHFDSPRHVGLGLETTESCYLSQWILYNNTDWGMKSLPATRTLTWYMRKILRAMDFTSSGTQGKQSKILVFPHLLGYYNTLKTSWILP